MSRLLRVDCKVGCLPNADGRNRTATNWERPKMLHADVCVVVTHTERYTDIISVSKAPTPYQAP